MVCCAVFGCLSNNNKKLLKNKHNYDSDVKFFRFPKDKKIMKIWLQKCHRKDSFKVKNSYVCSLHFKPEDYLRNLQHELLNYSPKNSKKLKPDAIPSENVPCSTSVSVLGNTERCYRLAKRNIRSVVCDLLKSDDTQNDEIVKDEEIIEPNLILKCDKSTDTADLNAESKINMDKLIQKNAELEKKCFELQRAKNSRILNSTLGSNIDSKKRKLNKTIN